MIEVRIRHVDELRSVHLCHWPATDLDSLLVSIGSWTVMTNDGEAHETPDLDGQVVYSADHREAYFEILIDDGEA